MQMDWAIWSMCLPEICTGKARRLPRLFHKITKSQAKGDTEGVSFFVGLYCFYHQSFSNLLAGARQIGQR